MGCGLGGKLGHGTRNDEKIPTEIVHFRNLNFQPVAVAAGAWHAAALSSDGRVCERPCFGGSVPLWLTHFAFPQVATWGWGRHGCLGHGGDQCELVPRVLEVLHLDGGPRACQISAGDYTTFVLGRNGEVWSFGHTESLCLGHPLTELEIDDGHDSELEGMAVQLLVAVNFVFVD